MQSELKTTKFDGVAVVVAAAVDVVVPWMD
jgi:hypothetical protein